MNSGLGDIMKQAQKMQENMQRVQEEIAATEVQGRVRRGHGESRHDRKARREACGN